MAIHTVKTAMTPFDNRNHKHPIKRDTYYTLLVVISYMYIVVYYVMYNSFVFHPKARQGYKVEHYIIIIIVYDIILYD
jgi:hypothetical protein